MSVFYFLPLALVSLLRSPVPCQGFINLINKSDSEVNFQTLHTIPWTMEFSNSNAKESLQKLVDVANKRWISMNDLFDQADVDDSGAVTKEEMQLLLNQVHLADSVNFDAVWIQMDQDKRGEVNRKEWHDCFSQIEPSKVSTEGVKWSIEPTYFDDVP